MENIAWRNYSPIAEVILLGFTSHPGLQIPLFLLFLMIYAMTMAANISIIMLVVADQHLHTPMYFFLGNLSCLEACYSSTILPRLLVSFLTGDRTISISCCILQYYCFGSLTAAECFLLAVMSLDRYMAICKPLHYGSLMRVGSCLQLAAVSWISGFLATAANAYWMSGMTLCGPTDLDHFFCDFTPLLKLSCSDTSLMALVTLLLSALFTLPPFILTLTSYMCIITVILRIPSSASRHKAFSTCSSHLIVVTIYYGTIIFVYVLPDTNTLRPLNKLFSLFYTVITPLANPLIYSLRNHEVRETLRRTFTA
ncbi:olfactory receptor 2G3-like [Rhea pennata]|uniref:olfactory receptor 2G3-like n=1 Tax=Rhea pennata TaxID=8795 RepID=UPI002E2729CA